MAHTWSNTNLFMQKTHGDFKPRMPTAEDIDKQIARYKAAKKKASTRERKWMIKQVIKEMKILKEQL